MSPLANQDPLAQLNDIIAPSAPSWFPPAPIYWVLLIVLISSLYAGYYFFKKNQQQRRLRQSQLHTLAKLEQQGADFIALNQLLKGCALSYYPRVDVASLHGARWFNFLQQHSAIPIFKDEQHFMARLYQPEKQACNKDDFIDAKKWITALPKQIKKAQKDV